MNAQACPCISIAVEIGEPPRDAADLLAAVSMVYVVGRAPVSIGRIVRELARQGLAIGACLAYPDTMGSDMDAYPDGMPLADDELEHVLLTQLAALDAIARRHGARVRSVKCHGALAFDVAEDERTAQVVARALHRYDPDLALVVMAGKRGVAIAHQCGLKVVQEAYIDRAYDRHGSLASRKLPGALITDPDSAAEQLLGIVRQGRVRAVTGEDVALKASSFCLHGDTPNARAIALAVQQALAREGIAVGARA